MLSFISIFIIETIHIYDKCEYLYKYGVKMSSKIVTIVGWER